MNIYAWVQNFYFPLESEFFYHWKADEMFIKVPQPPLVRGWPYDLS